MRPLVLALSLLVLASVAPASAGAASRSCARIANPYPDSRYEGVPLSRIRAEGVSCANARRVARGAHRKALGLAPAPDGILRLRWRSWRVTGDLRGANDRYVARRGDDRVRWRF